MSTTIFLLVACMVIISPAAAAVRFQLEHAHLPQFVSDFDPLFGSSVAFSGSLAIVGAPTASASNIGAAVIMKRTADGINSSKWSAVGNLTPESVTSGAHFGLAVAVAGQTVAISAPGDILHDKPQPLPLGGMSLSTNFGYSLAIDAHDGKTLIVGQPLATDGSAYVYVRGDKGVWDDWELQAQLVAPEGLGSRRDFGFSVACWGDLALVGAPRESIDDVASVGSVASYVRVNGSWVFRQLLRPSDSQPSLAFGSSMSALYTRVVIGAPARRMAGRAYVFRYDRPTWEEEAVLEAPLGGSNTAGFSVAMSPRFVLVGTYHAQVVYVWERADDDRTWTLLQTLKPNIPVPRGYFGRSVAIERATGTILVGAPGPTQGESYVYYFKQINETVPTTTTTTSTIAQPTVTTAPDRPLSNRTTMSGLVDGVQVGDGGGVAVAVGAGAGVAVLVAIAVLLLYCVVRRRRRTRRSVADKARAATPERRHKLKSRSASRAHGMSRSGASSRRQSKNYGKLPVMQPAGEHYQLGELTLVDDEPPYSNVPGAAAKSFSYEHGDMLLQGNVSETYERGEAMLSAQLAGAEVNGQYQRGPIPSQEDGPYGTVGVVDGESGYERGELLLNNDDAQLTRNSNNMK